MTRDRLHWGVLRPWQAHVFWVLFRPLPIPRWVMATELRFADLLMVGCGIASAVIRRHHPTASNVLLVTAALVGVLMLAWYLHVGHHVEQYLHRVRKGLCLNCGYDLRATPERCPECGVVARNAG